MPATTTALGRFIQADTIVPSPANPQSLNRYAYVLNNPLRYTDPTGHKECDRFCEGERIDDRTIGSEYTGPYNTSLSPEEQMAIIESTPGFAAMPIVALTAPGYAGRGVVSVIGYFFGSKGKVDVKGLQLAFYVGGIDNVKWWWGAASNNIQYLLDRFTEGDMPTSGKEWLEMGNDVLWNGATGTVATSIQPGLEQVLGKTAGTIGGEWLEGVTKGVSPALADAFSQWVGNAIRTMSSFAVTQAPSQELPPTPYTMP